MVEDSFQEYRLKILGDIQRQNDSLLKLQDIVTTLSIEVGQLRTLDKIRSIAYGNLGGIIAAVIVTILAERWFPR